MTVTSSIKMMICFLFLLLFFLTMLIHLHSAIEMKASGINRYF